MDLGEDLKAMEDVSRFIDEGLSYFNKGEYTQAIDCFQKLLQINPRDGYAYNNIGCAYLSLKKYQHAVESFRKAVEFEPMDSKSWSNMGLAHRELSEYKEAFECYRKAVELNPQDSIALFGLGRICLVLGEPKGSIDFFQRSISINPNNADACWNLGNAYGLLKQFTEAIECFQKGIQLQPGFSELHYSLGVAYGASGQAPEAAVSFRKTIELDPHNADAYYNLGIASSRVGLIDEAKDSFKKAVELYKKQGDDAKAEEAVGRLNQLITVPMSAVSNYPKPDRSNFNPNFVKTPDNDVLDISWNEGILSDGRPFRVEYWCQDQVSMLTYFFSTKGMQNASDDDFVKLLEREGLLKFKSDDKRFVTGKTLLDSSGNEMWSVNVVIGDEEGTFAKDLYPLNKYSK